MMLWAMVLGLPLVVYVALSSVQQGRPALYACAAVGLLIGLTWLAFALDIGGLAHGRGNRGAYVLICLTGLTIAWGVAASLQLIRLRLPREWPGWSWTLIVLICLAAATLPFLRLLGF